MKQNFYSLIILMSLAVPLNGYTQDKPAQVFTLDQCIEYALQNSVSAKNSSLDEEIARAKVKETIGIGLPQVTGSASVVHNEKLRRFFTTYNPNGGFVDLSGVPGIQAGDVVGVQNFFQLKNTGEAGVNINQILFNGSYLVGLQASNAYKDLAYKATAQTKEQIVQQVTKAYYSVLINRERVQLFNSNINRVDSLLKNTKALFQNGFAESIDADRIQVALNNLNAERDKFLNMNELILALLKFQMNYPMNDPIEIAGSIQDIQVERNIDEYNSNWDYKSRPDYQVMEANKKLQQLNIKNQYAQAMPSLSAFANLGYSTQSGSVGGIFKTESNINDANGVGPDKWYGFSLIGVSLNVPLFGGFQQSFRIQQEKLKLQKIDNSLTYMKSGIDLEIQQASINFDNALKSLTVQEENRKLAEKVARVTKIKYEQGVGSNLEVIDAEDSLRQAQTNYYNALFDAMIAKVDIDKAYGKLKVSETK